jgi:hypothetical protein
VIDEKDYEDQVIRTSESLCKNFNILLILNKIKCEDIYPIVIIGNRESELLPEIKDEGILKKA